MRQKEEKEGGGGVWVISKLNKDTCTMWGWLQITM